VSRAAVHVPEALDLGVRADFPLLVEQPDLVYLDSAATTQRPKVVLAAEQDFYLKRNASVHRGVYTLAEAATASFEAARAQVAQFIGAQSAEVIFTSGATAALNLAVYIDQQRWQAEDEIVIALDNHHSMLLPLQRAAQERGVMIRWLAPAADGSFNTAALEKALHRRTQLVAVSAVSNVLGTRAPVAEIARIAHRVGARVLVDAAQAIGHQPVDVQKWHADYVAASGHKAYGTLGIGWLYGRQEHIAEAQPQLLGGGAVAEVTQAGVTWLPAPHRFEAGTPNVAGACALAAALQYLTHQGLERIAEHEAALTKHLRENLELQALGPVYGPAAEQRGSIVSFAVGAARQRVHSHDVAQVLNEKNIAVRGGHHCAQPLLTVLGETDLVRVSVGLYTTRADIDRLLEALTTLPVYGFVS
jgi:cysteine desulfurase/selenocysteine lyase